MINALFYLTFLLFSLGQLGRVSLSNSHINFYLYEPLLLLGLVILTLKFRFDPIAKAWEKYKPAFVFFIFLLFTYFLNYFSFNQNENIVSALYLLRLIFYPALFVYLNHFLKKAPQYKKTLLNGFYLLSILTLVSSLLQYFFYPDLRNLYYLGWDPHLNRLFGTFFDTSITSAFYGILFLFYFKNKKFLLSLPFLLCVALTFSRSSYIFLLFVIIVTSINKNNFKYGILAVLIFALSVFIAPKNFGLGVGLNRTFSISSRLSDYSQAINIWSKSPLIGFGYDRIEFVKAKLNLLNLKDNLPMHSASGFSSSYLIILVSSGIIGLVLFFWGLFSFSVNNKNIFYAILFIGLMSLTDNIILHPFIIFIIGVLACLNLPYDRSR